MVITVLLLSKSVEANSIWIAQSGANLDITVIQDGDNNSIGTNGTKLDLRHDNNEIYFKQEGEYNEISYVSYWGTGAGWGGDLDGTGNTLKFYQRNTLGASSSKKNIIGFHIPSNDNDVIICQGDSLTSITDDVCGGGLSGEYGGHEINIDLHGGDNKLRLSQQTDNSGGEHYMRVYTYNGTGNEIYAKQLGGGDKWLQLTVATHGGEQNIIQKGSGDHTATVTLGGSYKTDFDLTQNSGSDMTYTLNQNCQTSSGCTVDVTQN
jgi:hypothetical protein